MLGLSYIWNLIIEKVALIAYQLLKSFNRRILAILEPSLLLKNITTHKHFHVTALVRRQ